MTIDKSLKVNKGIVRARNVLTRAERIERLVAQDRWSEGDGPFGLPKVRVYKVVLKKKKKAKGEEEAAGDKGAKGAPKAAAGAKTAAPKKK
ncbi:MAG: small basic protein [Thermoguttaceae bacterium]